MNENDNKTKAPVTGETTVPEVKTAPKGKGAPKGKPEPKGKDEPVVKPEDPEELVEYTAPLDPKGESRDITVGVNGEFIYIKRGSTVWIKRKFLEVLRHADEQQMEAIRARDRAIEAGKKPLYEA